MRWCALRLTGVWVGVLMLAAPMAAQEQSPTAAQGALASGVVRSTPAGLDLLLGAAAHEQRFHLFGNGDAALWQALPGHGRAPAPVTALHPLGLLGPSPLVGTQVLVWDPAVEGKLRLQLFRLRPRTWDDLTPWEKVGYVTATASAVAGMGYMLSRLF